jgi:hypothetical protein
MPPLEKPFKELTGEEYQTIFTKIHQACGLAEIKRALKDRDPNTIARAFYTTVAIIKRNEKTILSDDEAEEIADSTKCYAYNATAKYVQNVYFRHFVWERKLINAFKTLNDEQISHLVGLLNKLKSLRLAVRNPMTLIKENDHSPLHIAGINFELDPITWFFACEPNLLRASVSGLNLSELRVHMGNSPFWKDYEHLEKETKTLQRDYETVSEILKGNENLYLVWSRIQDEREKMKPWLITLSTHFPFEEYRNINDEEAKREIAEVFKLNIPKLNERWDEMNHIVWKIYGDIMSEDLERIIIEERCSSCREK